MSKPTFTLLVCKPQLPPGYMAQASLWPQAPAGLVLQHCPMLGLQPLPLALQSLNAWVQAQPADPAAPTVVVFVSPAALEFALATPNALGPWPAGLTCAVMGQQSAALAQHLGVPATVIVAPGPPSGTPEDADGLLHCLQQRFAAGTARVLLCKGPQGRADLATRLSAWALHCTTLVCYTQQPVQHPASFYQDLLENPEHKALWATSSAALQALHRQLQQDGQAPQHQSKHGHPSHASAVAHFLRTVPVLATHSNIAQTATGLGFGHVHLLATGIQSAFAWFKHRHV